MSKQTSGAFKLLRARNIAAAGAIVYPAANQHASSWYNTDGPIKTHMAVTMNEDGAGPAFVAPMSELVAVTGAGE